MLCADFFPGTRRNERPIMSINDRDIHKLAGENSCFTLIYSYFTLLYFVQNRVKPLFSPTNLFISRSLMDRIGRSIPLVPGKKSAHNMKCHRSGLDGKRNSKLIVEWFFWGFL